jgi:HAD superfamily hydrolase (TIGR01509 family)
MKAGRPPDTIPGARHRNHRESTMNANDTGPGSNPPPAGGEHHARADQVEATGWAAELELLAGGSWMALSAGEMALRGASHYLAPEAVRERKERLVRERALTLSQLHGLARDHHTDSPLLHWLDEPIVARRLLGLPREVTACVFDLDSVLTTSTSVHIAAWADTLDSFLLARSARSREPFVPFDRDRDYQAYVAERPRLEGVRAFLESRGIRLEEGAADDTPETETVHGLANRKEEALERHLARDGVAAYVGSRCYLEAAHLVGIGRAVVTSSANTTEILERAGLAHLVDQRVDAATIAAGRLASKPEPDTLIAACELLGVEPGQAADFETTPAGIAAARTAGFRAVIGIQREGPGDALHAAAPDVVVNDLAQLLEHRA